MIFKHSFIELPLFDAFKTLISIFLEIIDAGLRFAGTAPASLVEPSRSKNIFFRIINYILCGIRFYKAVILSF